MIILKAECPGLCHGPLPRARVAPLRSTWLEHQERMRMRCWSDTNQTKQRCSRQQPHPLLPLPRSWVHCLGKKTTSPTTQFRVVINDALMFGGPRSAVCIRSSVSLSSSSPEQPGAGALGTKSHRGWCEFFFFFPQGPKRRNKVFERHKS